MPRGRDVHVRARAAKRAEQERVRLNLACSWSARDGPNAKHAGPLLVDLVQYPFSWNSNTSPAPVVLAVAGAPRSQC